RHELLPQLARDWNPSIVETLAHTADWANAEEEYWEAEIDRLASSRFVGKNGAVLVRVSDIAGLPLAVARRLVRRAISMVKGDLRAVDFGHVDGLLRLCSTTDGSGRYQPPGLDVFRSFDWLRVSRAGEDALVGRNYSVAAAVPGETAVPGTGVHLAM